MMKAISLWQPWASFMALGFKANETRGLPPHGPWPWVPEGTPRQPGRALEPGEDLVIHAAKRCEVGDFGPWNVERDAPGQFLLRGPDLSWPYRLPLGAVVAVVRMHMVGQISWEGTFGRESVFPTIAGRKMYPALDHQHEEDLGLYEEGRWAWITNERRPIRRPIPCNGRQGVFDLPADVEELVRSALGRAGGADD